MLETLNVSSLGLDVVTSRGECAEGLCLALASQGIVFDLQLQLALGKF